MRILKIAVLAVVCLIIVWLVLSVEFKWRFKKPEAIILIDVADYSEEVKESIFEWFVNNDELRSKIDIRVIMTVNADFVIFNPFRFYDELKENTGVESPVRGTTFNWTAAMNLTSECLKKQEIFPGGGEKNLIIISREIDFEKSEQLEALKQFQIGHSDIKITMTTFKDNSDKPKKFPFRRKSQNLAGAEAEPRFFVDLLIFWE